VLATTALTRIYELHKLALVTLANPSSVLLIALLRSRMHVFPESASDDEIKQAVEEWSKLLAQKRFAEALTMFPTAEPEITADELRKWITGYGSPEPYLTGEPTK
jgi:hypothetical protein